MLEPLLLVGGAFLLIFGRSIVRYGLQVTDRFSIRTGLWLGFCGAAGIAVAIILWARP